MEKIIQLTTGFIDDAAATNGSGAIEQCQDGDDQKEPSHGC